MGNEVFFEEKKYISARRASRLFGYNSDYIGQLCRRSELDCRMVGRTWFVTEDSLNNHKLTAEKKPRGRISIYEKKIREKLSDFDAQKSSDIYHEKEHNVSEIFYSPHLLDTVLDYEGKPAKRGRRIFSSKVAGVFAVIIIFIFISIGVIFSFDRKSTLNDFVQDPVNFASNEVNSVFVALNSSISDTTSSLQIVADVFGSLRSEAHNIYNRAYLGLLSISNSILTALRGVGNVIVKNDSYQSGQNLTRERQGVTVVPSAGNEQKNNFVKKYITDAFSDETTIVPDKNGNSGLIKPIFSKKDKQEYLYVIVPVKEPINKIK